MVLYNIAMYCLDLKMKPFFKFTPLKRNHNIDALIFVCANQHMFPVLDDTVRKSIVATTNQKKGFCGGKIKPTKSDYNQSNSIKLNVMTEELK